MPNKPKTHQEVRKEICIVCVRKIPNVRKIQPNLVSLIKQHVYNGYTVENDALPSGICTACRLTLTALEVDIFVYYIVFHY